MTVKRVFSLLTAISMCGATLACSYAGPATKSITFSPVNSYPQSECRGLSMGPAKLKLLAATHNPFWVGGESQQQAYLTALNDGSPQISQSYRYHKVDTADDAAIVLASVAKGNLPLLEATYNTRVERFFGTHLGSSVMFWSAVCNFAEGVKFLLDRGVNPNIAASNKGAGPFNVALLYPHSRIPELLLKHGYSISHNFRYCKSSKYTLHIYRVRVDSVVALAIEKAICTESQ